MRLRRRRCIELWIVVAALALFAAPSAGAVEAGEEPGGSPPPGETTTESPGSTAEPAPSSSGSTGWTPVGPDTGVSSDGAAQIRRGSSLGSGGGSEPAGSTGEEEVGSTGGEPSYAGSGGGYEPESSTPSTFGEAPSERRAERTTDPVAPPAPIDKAVDVAIGTGTPLTLPEAHRGDDVSSASPAPAAPLTDSGDQATSVFDALLSVAAIVLGLGLVYAGWRVGLHLWHRRAQRRHLEVRWRRKADWDAAVRQIELRRAPAASNGNGGLLQRTEVGAGSAPVKVRTGGPASQDPARETTVKAG